MKSVIRDDTCLVGEVRCLNCGRTLAEAVRNPLNGKLRLRPAPNQRAIQAHLVARRKLTCARCRGTAFLEPLIHAAIAAYADDPERASSAAAS